MRYCKASEKNFNCTFFHIEEFPCEGPMAEAYLRTNQTSLMDNFC